MYKKIFLLALSLCTATAYCQTLWRGTAVGMSVSQIKKIIPEAAEPVKPSRLYGSEANEDLCVPSFALAGGNFEGRLYFLNGKLSEVHLVSIGANSETALDYFNALQDSLTKKYGPGVNSNFSSSTVWSKKELWVKKNTMIELSGYDSEGGTTVAVSYKAVPPARPDEASKL